MKDGPARIAISLSWDPIAQEDFVRQRRIYRSGAVGIWDRLLNLIDCFSFRQISRSYYKYNYNRVQKYKDTEKRDAYFAHYDLDLYCYIYDSRYELVTVIGPESLCAIDKSGKVYHSGDNFSGHGFDEQVHIQTDHLPIEYTYFVFAVKSDCRYHLNEINNIVFKVEDSKSGQIYSEVQLHKLNEKDPYGYAVALLKNETGHFTMRFIHAFLDVENDWKKLLRQYLQD